jgi:hypothetical protein
VPRNLACNCAAARQRLASAPYSGRRHTRRDTPNANIEVASSGIVMRWSSVVSIAGDPPGRPLADVRADGRRRREDAAGNSGQV